MYNFVFEIKYFTPIFACILLPLSSYKVQAYFEIVRNSKTVLR